MKYKWICINKETNLENTNDKLIVFFNGWGMDENIVSHLDNENYNVLMFYDYNTLKTDFDFSSLEKYKQKYLVAWSMGVMTATLFNIEYNRKTAINGTLKPIDDKFGIPVKIYDLTLKGLTPKGVTRFIKNMFSKEDLDSEIFKKTFCEKGLNINRDFENQKSELEALTHYKANPDFKYDRVIISTEDKIIPTKNQIAFWNKEANLKSGHAPFYHFEKWSELL